MNSARLAPTLPALFAVTTLGVGDDDIVDEEPATSVVGDEPAGEESTADEGEVMLIVELPNGAPLVPGMEPEDPADEDKVTAGMVTGNVVVNRGTVVVSTAVE